MLGINGSLFCWFSDYLSNRLQQVTVFGKTSNLLPVISAVPQGSILGPLMFLIHVNDLATVSRAVARKKTCDWGNVHGRLMTEAICPGLSSLPRY